LPAKFGANANQSTLTIPKSMVGISVQLSDYARVAGFVEPGSRVAIFACALPTKKLGKPESDPGTCKGVRLLLSNVEVIGVGDTSILTTTTTSGSGAQQTTDQVPTTILTIAVDQRGAEKTILADANGDLTFALMTDSSDIKATSGTWVDHIF